MTREPLPHKAVYSNNLVAHLLRLPDDETAVRKALTCPLSGKVFVDPVFAVVDGETYERDAINDFFCR